MLFIWIISCFFFLPSCLTRVLESSHERQVRSANLRSRSGSNYLYKPSLRIRSVIPEKMTVKTGENNVLECEAGGNPPPTIHWLKDGKRVSQSLYEALHPEEREGDYSVPILGLSFTRSRLFMDCVTAKDAGIYTCVAENCVQEACTKRSKMTRMFVKDLEDGSNPSICLSKKKYGSPARIHMWTHTRLEIQGSDAELFCRPEGEPRPEIMWVGPNNTPIVDSEKYQILSSGDLLVRSINWEDMGGYTCAVKNPVGYDETVTFLYPTADDDDKSSDG